MATITAHALIGQAHPYDGGVTNVTHQLWLTENSMARWTLMPMGDSSNSVRLIPHPDTLLEDGLLMIGLFVTSDQNFKLEAERQLGPLEHLQVIPDDKSLRDTIHTLNRKLALDLKIALTIFEGSSLMRQYHVLDLYQGWDVEVCISCMRRENPRSGWFVSGV